MTAARQTAEETKKDREAAELRAAIAREHVVAMTVAAFCDANDLSRPWFYRLMARGEAPRTFLLGRKRYISAEEAKAWARRMTEAGAA